MEFAFQYEGRTPGGSEVRGIAYGKNALSCASKLRRAGYTVKSTKLDWKASLASAFNKAIPVEELVRVYEFCAAQRQSRGNTAESLLVASELVSDPRLQHALQSMALVIQESGLSIGEAARQTGVFSGRDVEVLIALEKGGDLVEGLRTLADDHRRTKDRSSNIRNMLITPAMLGVVFYVLVYALFAFILPPTAESYLQNFGDHIPAAISGLYHFALWYRENLALCTIVHLVAGIAIVAFLRSSLAKRLVLSFKLPRNIAERSDLAMMWSSFRLLYQAGMPKEIQLQALQRMATMDINRRRARRFAQFAHTHSEAEAAEKAKFPRYVCIALKASRNGSLPEQLNIMVQEQINIVNAETATLSAAINLSSLLFGGALVLLFYAISVLPNMIATLTNL
ncbi:hypothetical protein HA052_04985 [Chromobacterium haemolyticum]|uniref:Type II secretion system protein GspF domain-containing protein n=1 Tax=Chromobacterium fluminis TaxID=3044269 RepID=A0ABX0L0F0_9NEIS|nr:type II secretion system F family protein [Chromobacterium haemolyticum]NHR04546.1 hypothetical protein [Chromobacterium haemolyticum]